MSPKKGKGSKLARMSDEERARYLQHRAAIEEEARRRKQQLIATFVKNKLKKEEAFSRLNMAKINQQWRQTLRVLKCKELEQDLNSLHQWFNHTAAKKNQLIDCLIGDLHEAETQYARMHQCHMETIDELLGIFNGRISVLQDAFGEKQGEMFSSACSELEAMESSAAAEQEHLHAIIFRMQKTSEEDCQRTRTVQNTTAEELRNHMLTELENLANGRSLRMEILWNSFQSVIQKYWEQTEDRRREYLNLRHADEENCRHIFKYHQQINSLTDALAIQRNQLNGHYTKGSDQLAERKGNREDCVQLFQVLRHKLKLEKNDDYRKLCRMSDAAYSATRSLNEILAKGQQILQMLNLCKKLETDADVGAQQGDAEDIDNSYGESCQDSLADEAFGKLSQLDGFWKRYNLCSIEKEALALECQRLETEQRHLKSVLKKYFTEFSSSQPLPVAPLTINRPHSTIDRHSINLRGRRVESRTGRIEIFADGKVTASFAHTLTIELTKS